MTAKRQSNVRTGTATLFGRAAIYARISLDKVGEAAGVGRQIDACRQLADVEGWSVDEVLVDNDLSAYSGACRPEYERLLDLVRPGAGGVPYDKLDWNWSHPADRRSQRAGTARPKRDLKSTGEFSRLMPSRLTGIAGRAVPLKSQK